MKIIDIKMLEKINKGMRILVLEWGGINTYSNEFSSKLIFEEFGEILPEKLKTRIVSSKKNRLFYELQILRKNEKYSQ